MAALTAATLLSCARGISIYLRPGSSLIVPEQLGSFHQPSSGCCLVETCNAALFHDRMSSDVDVAHIGRLRLNDNLVIDIGGEHGGWISSADDNEIRYKVYA